MAGTSIKTKLAVALLRKTLDSMDRLIDAQEALAIACIENTKALQRIEHLLDEQADIAADTRDAVVEVFSENGG